MVDHCGADRGGHEEEGAAMMVEKIERGVVTCLERERKRVGHLAYLSPLSTGGPSVNTSDNPPLTRSPFLSPPGERSIFRGKKRFSFHGVVASGAGG